MDLSESGEQIGEKLFVLLDKKQKKELTSYVISRDTQNGSFTGNSHNVFDKSLADNLTQPLTEIQEGDLYFCLEERKVCVHGQKIELTAKEFDALYLLIINRRRVLTFETIAYQVWGEEYIDITQKAIHNLFSRLRQKLQVAPDLPEYIVSVRGIGYKFDTGIC